MTRAQRGWIALVCCLLLAAGAVYGAGHYLSKPSRHRLGAPPAELFATSVVIESARGDVAGWVARGAGSGAVLLLHGVRSDRRQMQARAMFLNRLGSGTPGTWLAPLLLQQIPWRTDVQVASLRPVEAMASLKSPVFVIGGDVDVQTPPGETRKIFAAANHPKQLWIVDGAAHVDLHDHAGGEYERQVATFLATHLRVVE